MSRSRFVRQTIFPILAAFIWGTAFVAQSVSTEFVGPFTFNTARSVVAFAFLLGLTALLRLRRRRDFGAQAQPQAGSRRELLLGGACCGAALTAAAFLQQLGMETTSSGKAGFITALYIVIVPVAGVFLKRKVSGNVWVSVALAVAGLYCLCIRQGFAVDPGDFYVMLSALCFSCHILLIDRFTRKVDGVELSCVQFLVASVLSAVGMLLTETPAWDGIRACLGSILYVGVFSSGVGYTLQILAQKDSNPTVVSLLLSLEALFATVAGAVILGDRMSGREYLGCAVMLAAVILAQLPGRKTPAADPADGA